MEARQPSSLLLVSTLGVLAVVAGLAIVVAYQWAEPRIDAHRASELRAAIEEVLGEPERYETRWVVAGRLVDSLPADVDSSAATPVYPGFDGSGRLVGYAVPGQKPGFQDVIRLIFGYDPSTDRVMGMTVLEDKETPGLGARIETDSAFIDQFRGVGIPLRAVRSGGGGNGDIDVITGSTISSNAVVDIINQSLDAVKPALRTATTDARAPSVAARSVEGRRP